MTLHKLEAAIFRSILYLKTTSAKNLQHWMYLSRNTFWWLTAVMEAVTGWFEKEKVRCVSAEAVSSVFNSSGPANSGRDSMGEAVGSSITNLRCMEGEDQTQSDPSVVTTELPPVEPSTPGEPYLAPRYIYYLLHGGTGDLEQSLSLEDLVVLCYGGFWVVTSVLSVCCVLSLALGAAQQEWLDLRIHSSACRWRLPGLRCFSKSEPWTHTLHRNLSAPEEIFSKNIRTVSLC